MIKLSSPYIPLGTKDSMSEVLHSGNLVQGSKVTAFEHQLAAYLDVEHVVAVSSGTAALHLALLSVGVTDGDEVIIPAYSFPAVANAVELTGARCIFADINIDDFCMNVDTLESLITPATKVIMPVQEFGQSTEMDAVMRLAKKYHIKVIEDAACAIGTIYNQKYAGTIGDIGCFSFHPRKILTTGEGGAVVTNNADIAAKVRLLRNHGMTPKNGVMDFITPGFNYRMTDFQAVMGILQLPELLDTIKIHQSQAKIYHQIFEGVGDILTDKIYDNRTQTYQTYQIIFESKDVRDRIKKRLFELEIESNIGAYCIPEQSYYLNKYQLEPSKYANASIVFHCGLALPIGRHLNIEHSLQIGNAVKQLVKNEL